MQALYPMVPLAHRQAVCVGIMSYNGRIHFGLIGDYDAMRDLESLGLDLEASIAELSEAVPKPQRRAQPRKAPEKASPKAESHAGKGNGGTVDGGARSQKASAER
jgi:diacylglycerol O-acyltransferase / wax synthase